MHELSLAQGIVDIVEAQARKERFTTVRRIHLLVGALAHVEPDALAFGFASAARGTVAEGATLDIERPDGAGTCVDCGTAVAVRELGVPCPGCGGFRVRVCGGEELRVVDLVVE